MLVSLVVYLESAVNIELTEDQRKLVYSEFESSKQLSSNYFDTIEKYFPDKFKVGVWESLLGQLFFGSRKWSCCQEVIGGGLGLGMTDFRNIVLAMDLEDRYGLKKCYEVEMSSRPYASDARGLEEAAKVFYDKSVAQLTEREIVELEIVNMAGTKYSPIRNPENLKVATDKAMNVE